MSIVYGLGFEYINETYNIAKYYADKNNGTIYEVKVKDVWLPSMPGEYDRMSLNCEWWLRGKKYNYGKDNCL